MPNAATYRVVLELSTTGSLGTKVGELGLKAAQADTGLARLGDSGKRMGDLVVGAAERMGGALERAADRAFELTTHIAAIGAAGGIAAATYGVAHLNRELEETNLSLATVFQTQGFASNFGDALKMSADQLSKMKADVKSLPGDLGQLSDIMKMIATPAAQGGASADQIRALAGRGMLVGRVLGVQQDVAARELAQLFAGRAGSHNILGSRLGLVGDSAERFNKESAKERVKEITNLFNTPAMNAAAGAFANTWTAQITTLADNVKYLMLAPATSGLFERVKHSIAEVNAYIDEHKEKIGEIASLVNRRLVAGWDEMEAVVKRIAPIVGPMLDRLAHMQPQELEKHLMHGGEAMLGMKVGGMMLSGAGSGLGMAMRLGGGGVALAGLGEALPALAIAAAAATPAIIAGAGAFDILTDKTSIYHDDAVRLSEDIGSTLGRIVANLQTAAKPAEHAAEKLGDKMGDLALKGLDKSATYAERTTVMLDHFSEGVGHFGDVLKYGLGQLEALAKFRAIQPEEIITPTIEKDVVPLFLKAMAPHEGAGATQSKLGAGGGGGGAHFYGPITIEVRGNNDPSRVARLTLDELKKLAKNPTSSKFAPNFEQGDH